ncbi:MAG: H-NS histone family protein [Comamonas sp.]|nr:H-NS histone family protein [Comamonas sp.]
MTSSYKQLLEQREQLNQQIAEARRIEMADAVARVRSIVADFSLTADDIFPPARGSRTTSTTKVAPKYRNPLTNETWTGRGKPPRWIQGQDREQFLIRN